MNEIDRALGDVSLAIVAKLVRIGLVEPHGDQSRYRLTTVGRFCVLQLRDLGADDGRVSPA
jgi:hypothetical protein